MLFIATVNLFKVHLLIIVTMCMIMITWCLCIVYDLCRKLWITDQGPQQWVIRERTRYQLSDTKPMGVSPGVSLPPPLTESLHTNTGVLLHKGNTKRGLGVGLQEGTMAIICKERITRQAVPLLKEKGIWGRSGQDHHWEGLTQTVEPLCL